MPGHIHPTHSVLVKGERKVGETGLGAPLTETVPILDTYGRLDSGGGEFSVSATGEFTTSKPTLTIPVFGDEPGVSGGESSVAVLDRIEEGNDVELTPLDSRADLDVAYRINTINPVDGTHRLRRVALSLEKHS